MLSYIQSLEGLFAYAGYAVLGSLGFVVRHTEYGDIAKTKFKLLSGIFAVGVPSGLVVGSLTESVELSKQFWALPFATSYLAGVASLTLFRIILDKEDFKAWLDRFRK
jgi:hypothetical protein